ncbi:MAG: glycosyltransferase N-terminal domain-containing protein, partial [Mesorhizobium sp.]|nr:glycosyltransferase N-terminal domain-containing protein [Mesorhizobium sp.]
MSERWARALLTGYRWAGAAVYPVVGGYVAWRTTRGKEERSRRRERYGIAGVPRPSGPLIWIHAASVGETLAVGPLIDRISGFGINIVLTTGTVTSASLVQDRFGDKVIHQYVPLDLKPALNR